MTRGQTKRRRLGQLPNDKDCVLQSYCQAPLPKDSAVVTPLRVPGCGKPLLASRTKRRTLLGQTAYIHPRKQ